MQMTAGEVAYLHLVSQPLVLVLVLVPVLVPVPVLVLVLPPDRALFQVHDLQVPATRVDLPLRGEVVLGEKRASTFLLNAELQYHCFQVTFKIS